MSSNRVLIFSKSADPGTVKTRLRKILSDEQCLSLHIALLKDTLIKVQEYSPVLYLSGSGFLPFQPQIPVFKQSGANLGERLFNAFDQELKNHSKVIVIGTDSPTFPGEQIDQAFLSLEHHDAVIGPSEDGGYYLIGMRTPIPEIFTDIAWGTATVLEATLSKIRSYSYQLLKTYFDVDTPEDIERLKEEMSTSSPLRCCREWMRWNL